MIRIVTDSTCEGPADLVAHPCFSFVPLYVMFGKEALRDRVDISTEGFWERLSREPTLPTTAQATPADFAGPFKRFTDQGDEVVACLISSKLSGTYESACIAQASLAGRPISVVDSYNVSIGLGLLVEQAVAVAEAGATRAEIVSRLTALRDRIHVLFVPETLEYLQKGGRIGRAQALAGTLLKLKPLLAIRDGEVGSVARARSKHRALESMLEYLGSEVPERGPGLRLAVVHAGAEAEAAEVAKQMTAQFGSAHIFTDLLGPVIGVHAGPGTIGAAACVGELAGK